MTEQKQTGKRLGPRDYQSPLPSDWCAGCGNFGILRAIQGALAALTLPPERVAVFGGIGCSGKTPYYLNTNGIHTLHGRLLPFAQGAKLAAPSLTVLAVGGDGDGLSIGAGHFVNAARRNVDITYILYNNGVYGLTKGQGAPTLQLGEQTRSMNQPASLAGLNPLQLALASGYSWIGRGYAYDVAQLEALIEGAISHPGTALLEVLQPCPTYNDLYTREWFGAEDPESGEARLYDLADSGYDPLIPEGADSTMAAAVREACWARSGEWKERIPLGIFLQDRSRATPAAVAEADIADSQGRALFDIAPLLSGLAVK